ncbi:MAG: molybdopterin-dependent oxidoreductase, partial [Flavobacteriaceae bacterium]|nr:molybdopterin-dependent oxidoreductase [Flavobacteriaceae bacterium]
MTKIITHYNRRSFLKISTAAGGGMLIGFSWLAGCVPASKTEEEIAEIPKEWFEINGYIKIGDTGLVTIYSPNPEIGQNVRTSMPMVVAEELDVDWKNVVVEQAPLNTGLYQNQFAGGSLSIRLSWDALRMAGATGRQMLLEAAAKEWDVKASDLTASKGVIKENNGERSITYGEIASKAVGIEIPGEVELKEPKDYKIIGTSKKNVDGKKIVTGESMFGLDFKKDGMSLAMIEHPPAFGMKVKSYNEEEIKSLPGIKDTFIIDTSLKDPQWSDVNAFPQLIAIIGDKTWQLMKAKKALKVDWETNGT